MKVILKKLRELIKEIFYFIFPSILYKIKQRKLRKKQKLYIENNILIDNSDSKLMRINMHSENFLGGYSSGPNKIPKYFCWDFGSYKNDISVYIDGDVKQGVYEKNNGKLKFLWLLESIYYNNGVFDYINNNLEKVLETYQEIWTYNRELTCLDPKFIYITGTSVFVNEFKLFEKKKLICMFVSPKTVTPMQKFRNKYANENKDKIDIFGKNYISFNKDFVPKLENIKDYAFSVEVENSLMDTYFCEKLLDCFATGTIPIYKGTRKVIDFFNKDGIIFLDDLKDLNQITFELYNSKIDAVRDNFERVKKFNLLEDRFYENQLKKYFK